MDTDKCLCEEIIPVHVLYDWHYHDSFTSCCYLAGLNLEPTTKHRVKCFPR